MATAYYMKSMGFDIYSFFYPSLSIVFVLISLNLCKQCQHTKCVSFHVILTISFQQSTNTLRLYILYVKIKYLCHIFHLCTLLCNHLSNIRSRDGRLYFVNNGYKTSDTYRHSYRTDML